jgi:hypothetical protein
VLGALVILAALFYSLYAFWIGAPKLMKIPAEKASGYGIVCMGASFVAALIIAMVFGALQTMLFVGSALSGGI